MTDKIKLALEISKIVHDNCDNAPHDIGLKIVDSLSLPSVSVSCNGYSIKEHPDLPDGSKVIWLENEEGEGTTVDVNKLFKWAM